MSSEINYFVSYTGRTYTGDVVTGRASTYKPITGIDRIDQLEKVLMETDNMESCAILNWQRFE